VGAENKEGEKMKGDSYRNGVKRRRKKGFVCELDKKLLKLEDEERKSTRSYMGIGKDGEKDHFGDSAQLDCDRANLEGM